MRSELSEDPQVEFVEEDGVVEASALQTGVLNIGLDRIDQRARLFDQSYHVLG